MIREIVVSTLVTLLAFFAKYIFSSILRGLPETHASEGRAAIRDAVEILNLVQSKGGMTSSRPWKIDTREIRQSDLDYRLATLQQRAKDKKLTRSLMILREALRQIDVDSVARTYVHSKDGIDGRDQGQIPIDNAKAERQLTQMGAARLEIDRLFTQISTLERRGVAR